MSPGWSAYVIALVVITLGGCAWLLRANRRATRDDGDPGTLHEHEYDGLREYNNPMPAWWMWLFVGTLLWAPLYFLLFPGFGHFRGLLGWTSQGQYEAEVAAAEARYGPLFARFAGTPLNELARDEHATEIGGRLFAHHCSQCHGSDARGGRGYPNLTDADWLYGGAPERVVETITGGRIGNMPALGPVVGDEGVKNLAQYVLSLSGRPHDAGRAAAAAPQFAQICAVCHGADGRGNQAVGAPDLTDDVWLHGWGEQAIVNMVVGGKTNQMPAQEEKLTAAQIHVLSGYVWSLSNRPQTAKP